MPNVYELQMFSGSEPFAILMLLGMVFIVVCSLDLPGPPGPNSPAIEAEDWA